MSSTDDNNIVYDIIFAGGGTAACVTAGRLAEADPSGILETGPHTREEPNYVQPWRYYRLRFHSTETFSFHVAKPSPALNNRAVAVYTGRALGGGSSVNSLFYIRAAASDYDDWENVYRNKGWGSKHLIPLLKKQKHIKKPLNISTSFLSVAKKFDKDRGLSDDTNAFFSCDAYGRWARYLDSKTGRRSDTAHHYTYNQVHNENLKILVRRHVVRIIFEGTCAVGIEYVDDTIAKADGTTKPLVARVSRLVILSAGAFGSPSILERSGIGSRDVLTRNNVQQLVDLVHNLYSSENNLLASSKRF